MINYILIYLFSTGVFIFTSSSPEFWDVKAIASYFLCAIIFTLPEKALKQAKLFFHILFALLLALNIEHIFNLDSNISLNFIKYLKDDNFIKGSFDISFITRLLLLLTFSVVIYFTDPSEKLKGSKYYQYVRYLFLTFGLLSLFLPIDNIKDKWVQMSFLEENVRNAAEKIYLINTSGEYKKKYGTVSKLIANSDSNYASIHPSDLKGSSLLNTHNDKNILLIAIEAISQKHINNNWAPNLKSMSQNTFSATNFIANQKMTNNGLYSIFCGRYPNLITPEAKSDILIKHKIQYPCLPKVLANNGFHTVFMQSANLEFMNKDIFGQLIGFDEILGNSSYMEPYYRSGWGVDDSTLYREALSKIKKLNKGKDKWFLSLLTVSTHHPYEIPDGKVGFKKAVQYADNAISKFIERLDKENLLKNTLVIITSDEANVINELAAINTLQNNWGFLIAYGAGLPENFIQTEYYSQADIPISILDYFNFKQHQEFGGRSIFRQYNTKRTILFGNLHKRQAYILDSLNKLYVCNRYYKCSKYTDFSFLDDEFNNLIKTNNSKEETNNIKNWLKNNDWFDF